MCQGVILLCFHHLCDLWKLQQLKNYLDFHCCPEKTSHPYSTDMLSKGGFCLRDSQI